MTFASALLPYKIRLTLAAIYIFWSFCYLQNHFPLSLYTPCLQFFPGNLAPAGVLRVCLSLRTAQSPRPNSVLLTVVFTGCASTVRLLPEPQSCAAVGWKFLCVVRSPFNLVGGNFMRARLFRQTLTAGFLLLLAVSASAQSWRQVGPPGGDVQSLAAVPGSTRTLFLGTSDGHVFGSHDAGEHWELLGRIGEHHDDVIMSMLVDSRSSKHALCDELDAGAHMAAACIVAPTRGTLGNL